MKACITYSALIGAVSVMLVWGDTPAAAQAWIGQVVGEAAAQQAAAAREAACRRGTPADPDDVKRSNRRADTVMEAYFALTSKSPKRNVTAVFATGKPDVSWQNADGKVPVSELGAQLDEPSPQHTKILSVVAGDNEKMRAIWSVGEGADTLYYGVDIINGDWLSSSRIWHLTISSKQPDTPPAYCHFDPERSF